MAILDSEGQPVHSGPDAAINRHVVPRHIEGREFGISNIVTSVLASSAAAMTRAMRLR
jgi:hypothetical protein